MKKLIFVLIFFLFGQNVFADMIVYDPAIATKFINKKGEFVHPPQPDNKIKFVFPKIDKETGLYGLVHDVRRIDSKWIKKPQFESITTHYTVNSQHEAKQNGLWGLIDNKSGNWVIKPQYDIILPFSDDLAAFCKDEKCGYIDKKNNIVLELKSQSLICYKKGGEHYYYRESKCNGTSSFSDGLAMAYDSYKYVAIIDSIIPYDVVIPEGYTIDITRQKGYIKDNKFYISETAPENHEITSGIVLITPDFKYINKKGEVVLDIKYASKGFSEGLAATKAENGLWGYINTQGEFVIQPKFQSADSFYKGVARVEAYKPYKQAKKDIIDKITKRNLNLLEQQKVINSELSDLEKRYKLVPKNIDDKWEEKEFDESEMESEQKSNKITPFYILYLSVGILAILLIIAIISINKSNKNQ